jgi:undecaprenyl-diphosphatase
MRARPQNLLLLFLLGLTLFRLAMIGQFPLTMDEAYYWAWSQRPDIVYYEQPGMCAWILWLASGFFPHATPFSVRLPAVILGLFSSWILYRAYRAFHDDEAEAAAFVMVISFLPIYFAGGFLYEHDTPLMFFSSLSYYFILKLLKNPTPARWYLVGLALTAALYSKFAAPFLILGFVLFIPLSRTLRPWLRRPHPYLAGLMSTFLFLPVLIWNYRHDWMSVEHIAYLTRTGSMTLTDRFSHFFNYLGSQFFAYSPLLYLTLLLALVLAVRRYRKAREEPILLLLTLSVPILLYLFLQSFRSHVYGNWSAIGYLPALMLTMRISATYLRLPFPAPFCFRRRFLFAGVILACFLSVSPLIQARYHLFSPAMRRLEKALHLDDRLDERLDEELLGWPELAAAVERSRGGTQFILARRYQIASILEFYLPDHPQIYIYSEGRRRSQFDLWTDFNLLQGKTGLFVDVRPIPTDLADQCQSVVPLEKPLKILDQGEVRKRFFIYRCEGFRAHPVD